MVSGVAVAASQPGDGNWAPAPVVADEPFLCFERRALGDVIVAGAIPPNPAELLESRKLGDLVDQLTGMYDLVVIDTPPVC